MAKKLELDEYLGGLNTVNTVSSPVIFSDQTTPALSIYNFLVKNMGEDWWENEFKTIEQYLKNSFGIELTGPNREKVHALQRLCKSNLSFIDWYEFNILAISLNGGMVDFDSLTQPTPGMVINTVKIMNKIRPNEKFGEETKKYITLVLIDNGIYTPPPSLVDLVAEYMAIMVTDEVRRDWTNSVKDSFKIMQDPLKNTPKEDSSRSIQANRVAKSELAASVYNS